MSSAGAAAPPALAAELVGLERALHCPQVRADHEHLAALLDEDFNEIGSSGQCYGREAALEEIPLERAQVVIESDRYAVWMLAEGLAQVRYRSRYHVDDQPQRWVLLCARWRQYVPGVRMVFHQGTPEAR